MLETKKEDILFSWEFLEFEKYQRGRAWYIIAGLTGLFLIVFGILTQNFLFAIIIILIGIVILFQIQKEPQKINFLITKDGIKIEEKFYPYQNLKSFWIIYQPSEVKNLYFQKKNALSFLIIIPLMDQDPIKIREVLLNYLDEERDKEESSIEKISRQIKI